MFIDAIESNAAMPSKSELQALSDNAERYTMFALGILYCGIAPLATTLVWIFILLDSIFIRHLDTGCLQRPRPLIEKDIDYWNTFAEVASLLSVLSNCFLLYNFTTTFDDE